MLQGKLEALNFLTTRLMLACGAYRENDKRKSYLPFFRDIIGEAQRLGLSFQEISQITNISIDSLKKFASRSQALDKSPLSLQHERLIQAWNRASPKQKKTLDSFTLYLSRHHSKFSFSRDELRQCLIDLGLHHPRGPKIPNHGSRVKRPFDPHALWEGDGKFIKIRYLGRLYTFVWYAFVDQSTTLIVGGNLDGSETAENFLKALKDGKYRTGTYPIGIVIDNRLPDTDFSPVKEYCDKYDIKIVRTFPGNSKSNGNIENNFGVFESFVGPIDIVGRTPEQIAAALAEAIIEVFTQQRNHSSRDRLGTSPDKATAGKTRPEHQRSAVEKIARRLEREITDIEVKWMVIGKARDLFPELYPEDEEKLKGIIKSYTLIDLIEAQAAYIVAFRSNPVRKLGSEYFLV